MQEIVGMIRFVVGQIHGVFRDDAYGERPVDQVALSRHMWTRWCQPCVRIVDLKLSIWAAISMEIAQFAIDQQDIGLAITALERFSEAIKTSSEKKSDASSLEYVLWLDLRRAELLGLAGRHQEGLDLTADPFGKALAIKDPKFNQTALFELGRVRGWLAKLAENRAMSGEFQA